LKRSDVNHDNFSPDIDEDETYFGCSSIFLSKIQFR